MPVMDEFIEEREALKNGTLKQKLRYFWDYYMLRTLFILIMIGIVVYFIYFYATKKDEMFCAAVLNCWALETADEYNQDFVEYVGMDPEEYQAFFDSTMAVNFEQFDATASASAEKLAMYMAAYQLDVIVAGESIYEHYANAGAFNDIRTYLTEEQIAKYEPYFYYVDLPLVEQIYQAELNTDTSFNPEIPDPTKPELMEKPVPVGIYVDSDEFLTHYMFRVEEPFAIGIVADAPHPETAAKYIDYLFE